MRVSVILCSLVFVACGPARHIAAPDGPPPGAAALKPEWSSIRKNILQPKCIGCHNPSGQARFLDLSSRESILAANGRISGPSGNPLLNPAQPEASYMIEVIRDPVDPMPPPKSRIEAVSEEELMSLLTWISLGMP